MADPPSLKLWRDKERGIRRGRDNARSAANSSLPSTRAWWYGEIAACFKQLFYHWVTRRGFGGFADKAKTAKWYIILHKSLSRRHKKAQLLQRVFFDAGSLFLTPPPFWNAFLGLKTQNFDVKRNCKNHFTFSQKNSEYAVLYENITRIGTQITINFQRWFSYFSFSME